MVVTAGLPVGTITVVAKSGGNSAGRRLGVAIAVTVIMTALM